MKDARSQRARLALDGLSVGDAFGQRFFGDESEVRARIARRTLPAGPWRWTDDTAMALGVVDVLEGHCGIDPDSLALVFAFRYVREPWRGYGAMAARILKAIAMGAGWRDVASRAFGGQGSKGNGAAMRAAPVGAYFADDLDAVVEAARASALPTHAHQDGQSGAVAAAVAAALAWRARRDQDDLSGTALLAEVHHRIPPGETRDGVARALTIPFGDPVERAASLLGNGSRVTAPDTVPFALWCAARHLGDYEEALWTTVSGLGDRDTTCAIVGGIVAMSTGREGIPRAFIEAREPIDDAEPTPKGSA